jgi:hypothetical protein
MAAESLAAFKLGDVASLKSSGPSHLLQVIGILACFGPWILVGDMVVEASSREQAISLSIMGAHSLVGLSLWAWAARKHRRVDNDFWVATMMFIVTILSIIGLAGARVDHLSVSSFLDARSLLRLATIHFAGICAASLRPEKAWCVKSFRKQ